MARGSVRVLIGTRKGGYIAESDHRRARWKVRGPYQAGTEVFHMVEDPRYPDRIYSLANSAFWGPMIARSTDGGKRWTELPTPLMARKSDRPPPSFDADRPPHPIVNLWHLEPGPASEPKTLFVGVDPARLYRSDDSGSSWQPIPGLNDHPTRPKWNPGAGGMCLHTIALDPTRPKRMYVGISAAGCFRTDDGGEHWQPLNRGVVVDFMPERRPEVGQCLHHMVLDPARPETLYRQDHNGIHVSRDSGESWHRVGRSLPYDFGFVVAAPPARPGEAFFFPLEPKSRITAERGPQVWRWSESRRSWSPTMNSKAWPGNFGAHREGMAADGLDPFGLYLGTTTGQLLYTPNGTKSWSAIPYQFPAIHSVSVLARGA